jgi:hypothetical protein
MPLYVFCLDTDVASRRVIEAHMHDEAARDHADVVAAEINRNRNEPLGLLVFDDRGQLVHRVSSSIPQLGGAGSGNLA